MNLFLRSVFHLMTQIDTSILPLLLSECQDRMICRLLLLNGKLLQRFYCASRFNVFSWTCMCFGRSPLFVTTIFILLNTWQQREVTQFHESRCARNQIILTQIRVRGCMHCPTFIHKREHCRTYKKEKKRIV